MQLIINGELRRFPAGQAPVTLGALLSHYSVDLTQVAVEKNFEIIPKSLYDKVAITDGDRIELVEFVGGG